MAEIKEASVAQEGLRVERCSICVRVDSAKQVPIPGEVNKAWQPFFFFFLVHGRVSAVGSQLDAEN